jgi:hypothetical protein
MTIKLKKKDFQVLWVFAALERLQHLGMIKGAEYTLSPEGIDLFLEVDEHRHVLFDDEEVFERVVHLVCTDKEMIHTEDEFAQIIQLVRSFRDNREDLVKFALSDIIKK